MDEKRKQISIRVKPNIHKIIKMMALNDDMTVQEYLTNLIIKDAVSKNPELKKELQ